MTVIVRDLRPDVRADAEGFSDTRRLALPYMLSTPRGRGAHPDARPPGRPLRTAGRRGGRRDHRHGPALRRPRQPGTRPGLRQHLRAPRTGRGAAPVRSCCAPPRNASPHWASGSCSPGCWTSRTTAPSPSGTASGPAAPPTSCAWTWQPARCRPARTRRRASNCARPPTSRTTRARVFELDAAAIVGRTERHRGRVHGLRGLDGGELEAPAPGPRPDNDRASSTALPPPSASRTPTAKPVTPRP